MASTQQTVAILGASANPERYARKALDLLRVHGHRVLPVNPGLTAIDGVPVVPALGAIAEPVDTLTLYLGPERLEPLAADIVALRPGRVIFNPGTESPVVQAALDAAGISWQDACTLVLLRTGQF